MHRQRHETPRGAQASGSRDGMQLTAGQPDRGGDLTLQPRVTTRTWWVVVRVTVRMGMREGGV